MTKILISAKANKLNDIQAYFQHGIHSHGVLRILQNIKGGHKYV